MRKLGPPTSVGGFFVPIWCQRFEVLPANHLKWLARPERFELPTPRFVVWCSIQLSYGRLVPVGPIARVRNGRIAIGSSRRWQAWPGTRPASCPATVPGIHVLLVGCRKEDVDGRVKPGHDAVDKSKRFGARRAGGGYLPPRAGWGGGRVRAA